MSHDLGKVVKNISIDCVIFGFAKRQLEILLIKRNIEPNKGDWALPGGFILKDEEIEVAAQRILNETTGANDIFMEQTGVFGGVHRYPERRVFTIGYYALIRPEKYSLHAGIDTSEVRWVNLNEIPALPFDHNKIIDFTLERLRTRIKERPVGFELLPKKFSISQLQALYESITGIELDRRNFRKKFLRMNLLVKLDEKDKNNVRRAATLYRFDKKTYNQLIKQGFSFVV